MVKINYMINVIRFTFQPSVYYMFLYCWIFFGLNFPTVVVAYLKNIFIPFIYPVYFSGIFCCITIGLLTYSLPAMSEESQTVFHHKGSIFSDPRKRCH